MKFVSDSGGCFDRDGTIFLVGFAVEIYIHQLNILKAIAYLSLDLVHVHFFLE